MGRIKDRLHLWLLSKMYPIESKLELYVVFDDDELDILLIAAELIVVEFEFRGKVST